ncbi:MAG: methylated-DNA--[protein]-cysteine S-methyltransferase [Holosporaceae bacterium]
MTISVIISSPIGSLQAVFEPEGALRSLSLTESTNSNLTQNVAPSTPNALVADALNHLTEQLAAYFTGQLQDFTLLLAGVGTDFQRDVWIATTATPYGQTTSYSELAKRIGQPYAARAVGAALGANPWMLIVPCHRVISSRQNLTGYAWGLPTKQFLLDHERGMARKKAG